VNSRFWNWEAGMFYGKNDQTDVTTGFFNISALRNALGPSFVDATGAARCGTAASVIDGCVPMNMLSGAGSLTQDMIDYAGFTAHDVYGYEQKTYYGSIGGELFDLPGGAFAFSLGAEHREESGFDGPDALINSGDTTGNARTATDGSYKLDEAYLELAIPLLSGVTGAQLLDFSVATRFSDYSNFGNTVNSKFGFRWKPINDLMIRGNWSEGFRAPTIAELYQGVSDTFAPASRRAMPTPRPPAAPACLLTTSPTRRSVPPPVATRIWVRKPRPPRPWASSTARASHRAWTSRWTGGTSRSKVPSTRRPPSRRWMPATTRAWLRSAP